MPSIGVVDSSDAVVRTPNGFLVLSHRNDADPNGLNRFESETALYHSVDGITWTRRELGADEPFQSLSDVVCGPKVCVVAGRDIDSFVSYTSVDGKAWAEAAQFPWAGNLQSLRYAGGQFFVASYFIGTILRSFDGVSWQEVVSQSRSTSFFDVAYGNGRYLAGASSLESPALVYDSVDGENWQARPSIELCDPNAGGRGCSFLSLDFVDGVFYGWGVQSSDGEEWTRGPTVGVRGVAGTSLISYGQDVDLLAWDPRRGSTEVSVAKFYDMKAEQDILVTDWARSWPNDPRRYAYPSDQQPPDELDFSWPDGLSCRNRRCVLRGGELFLIP